MMKLLRRQEVMLDLAESEAPCHNRIYEEFATTSPERITKKHWKNGKTDG